MNYIVPIISRYSGIAVQFLLVGLVTNNFSTAEAGTYFLISGAVLTLYFATGLGAPDGVVVTCPAKLANGQAAFARFILDGALKRSVLTGGVLATAFGTVLYRAQESWSLALASSVWLFGYCLVFAAAQNLIAIGRVRLGSFIFYTGVSLSLCLTSLPYLVLVSRPTLARLVAITGLTVAAVGIITLTYAYLMNSRLGPAQRTDEAPAAYAGGFTIAVGRVVQTGIIWAPVWIAGALLSSADAAQVGLASRLLGFVGALLAAVRFSVRPHLVRLAAANEWRAIEALDRRIATWATSLAVAAVLAAAALGEFIIPTIFGVKYMEAASLLPLVLAAAIAEAVGGPVDEILKMSGAARVVLRLQVGCLVFLLATAAALAPLLGSRGVCTTFVMAYVLLYGCQIVAVYKKHRILALPFGLLAR